MTGYKNERSGEIGYGRPLITRKRKNRQFTRSDLLGASLRARRNRRKAWDFSASDELAGLENAQRPDPAVCTLVQRNLDIDPEISQYFLQHVA